MLVTSHSADLLHCMFLLRLSEKCRRQKTPRVNFCPFLWSELTEQGHIHDQRHHKGNAFCNIKTFDILICAQLSTQTHSKCLLESAINSRLRRKKINLISDHSFLTAHLALCLHPPSERFELPGDETQSEIAGLSVLSLTTKRRGRDSSVS